MDTIQFSQKEKDHEILKLNALKYSAFALAILYFLIPRPGEAAEVAVVQPIQKIAAEADLQGKSGGKGKGVLHFTQDGKILTIKGELTNLEPNSVHAIHIHAKGDCSDKMGKSAGGHFNPTNEKHGAPDAKHHHLGDLGNFKTDKNGVGQLDLTIKDANIAEKSDHSFLHKAVVVHKKADDFKSQPAGDAGDRILCGVINTHSI